MNKVRVIGSGFAIILIIAIMVNYLVRVGGTEGSEGILMYWLGEKLYSDNYKHYSNSSECSARAIDLLMKHGRNILTDDSKEIVQDRNEAIKYLRRALTEAIRVEDSYLINSHPLLKSFYRDKYQESLQLFLTGLEKQDSSYVEQAISLYNEFLTLMKTHKNEFKRAR